MSLRLPSKGNDRGFTIIELMIAISVFSVVLLISISSLLYVAKLYYRGTTVAKTQNVARDIMANLTDAVKYNRESVRSIAGASPDEGAICVGSKKYSYKKNVVLVTGTPASGQSNSVFVESTDPSCTGVNPVDDASSPPRELMGDSMRLVDISVMNSRESIVQIELKIAYGGTGTTTDTDSFFEKDGSGEIVACKPGPGSEFCYVTTLSKTIYGAN